jgi:hypothetical protein
MSDIVIVSHLLYSGWQKIKWGSCVLLERGFCVEVFLFGNNDNVKY